MRKTTVSYTHLDVYKRQGLALAAILPFLGVQATFYIYSGLLIVVFIMALFVGEETLDLSLIHI